MIGSSGDPSFLFILFFRADDAARFVDGRKLESARFINVRNLKSARHLDWPTVVLCYIFIGDAEMI
jgi:hypothetical protein